MGADDSFEDWMLVARRVVLSDLRALEQCAPRRCAHTVRWLATCVFCSDKIARTSALRDQIEALQV